MVPDISSDEPSIDPHDLLDQRPRAFTENRGQLDNDDVRLYDQGGSVWFTDDGAWFDIFEASVPLNGDSTLTSTIPAIVKADFAGAENTWAGYVTRTTGQVDKMSRMISVVVEVPKPFERSNGRPPLLPGIFAEIQIQGKMLKSTLALPRDAIHEGNKVWMVKDDRLYVKTLDIVRTDRDFAYARASADQNATIVISSLDTVTEGMKVRTQFEQAIDAGQPNQDPNNKK